MDNVDGLMAIRVETVRELLSNLDRATVMRIFDRMSESPPRDERFAAHLTSVLIDTLNGGRRLHARRLWTSWLEPVLVRDHIGPASGRPLPGTINATDAAAWWAALAPRMAELVTHVQEHIAERAVHEPLDRILASDGAARWAEALRLTSITKLRAARNEPEALDALLAEANAERAALVAMPEHRLRPLDARDLDTLLAVLEAMAAWRSVAWRQRDDDTLIASVRGALHSGRRTVDPA